MFPLLPASLCSLLLILFDVDSSSTSRLLVSGQTTLTAVCGDDVTLPCRAPSGAIRAAEWSRPDLEPRYVFFYRDGKPDKTQQHPSYRNRVSLVDINSNNLSLILKDVIGTDTGTYECRVKQGPAKSRRSVISSEPISTVHLVVTPSRVAMGQNGNEHPESKRVGLLMFLLILSQIFFL